MLFVVKKIIYMFCTEHVVKHFFYYFEVLTVVQVNHRHSNNGKNSFKKLSTNFSPPSIANKIVTNHENDNSYLSQLYNLVPETTYINNLQGGLGTQKLCN